MLCQKLNKNKNQFLRSIPFKVDGVDDGITLVSIDGIALGNKIRNIDGVDDGITLGAIDGSHDGTKLGINDGSILGILLGSIDGSYLEYYLDPLMDHH